MLAGGLNNDIIAQTILKLSQFNPNDDMLAFIGPAIKSRML